MFITNKKARRTALPRGTTASECFGQPICDVGLPSLSNKGGCSGGLLPPSLIIKGSALVERRYSARNPAITQTLQPA